MNKIIVGFLLMLMFAAIVTGCQPASPPSAAAAPNQISPANTQAPSPQPAPASTPILSPPSPAASVPTAQPPAPPSLQIKVELEDGRRTVPIGIIVNAKYSTNRSANLTMVTALPDGSVINHFTLEIASPGSYLLPIRFDRPIGERTITLTAEGIDGQTATATYKYWAGGVVGNTEIP